MSTESIRRSASAAPKPPLLDFFAGSGLATEALKGFFRAAWANDISEKKATVYRANHNGGVFHAGPIERVRGTDLPSAMLSWASFPCQDLSLAGNLEGIESPRSGLVWDWLRVMDEMSTPPPLVVAENVIGLVAASKGRHYHRLHRELVERGYRVGALVLDAALWVPHSRPRVFVVGADRRLETTGFELEGPGWAHPPALRNAVAGLPSWAWWHLPEPSTRATMVEEIVDFDAPCLDPEKTEHNLRLIPQRHWERMQEAVEARMRVFPGYKRTRNGRQVLELRFDGVAGCLRTPQGGSSRQFLVIWRNGRPETRLLTVRETARLMGVRESYRIPGSYNDGYMAMGDAVAVPPVRHLARHLLSPLAHLALRGPSDRPAG